MRAIENVVRAVLREAGLELGTPARAAFAQRVRELAGDDQAVMPIVRPLLAILETMLAELARLTKQVLALARKEEVCRFIGDDIRVQTACSEVLPGPRDTR